MKTRKWTRSPRGTILGVATGFAEWRDLPEGPTRLIFFLIILLTGIFPGIVIYLILAAVLPRQKDEDILYDEVRNYNSTPDFDKSEAMDADFHETGKKARYE